MPSERVGCQKEQLMDYLDNELGTRERATVREHLQHCPSCQQVVRQGRSLSALFRKSMDDELSAAPLKSVEHAVLARVQQKTEEHSGKRTALWLKRALVPAGALAAASFLFFIMYGPSEKSKEPSAIINSFTAEAASVMILETPTTRQTILWFQEVPEQGGEDDRMQQV